MAENPSETNTYRYRHPEIKQALLDETYCKCVYCESDVRHNCPGDIEHKLPRSKRPDLVYAWENLTIACSECNRRKLDYYDPACPFFDPSGEDVESRIQHLGPFVFSVPGDVRSEVTIRLLELDKLEPRKKLVGRKLEKLESARNLIERIRAQRIPALKAFLQEELSELCNVSAEYSGMVKAYVEGLPDNWADN